MSETPLFDLEGLVETIREHLSEDRNNVVALGTHMRTVVYGHKNRNDFRVSPNGRWAEVRRGKRWDAFASRGTGPMLGVRYGRMATKEK